MLPNKSSTDDDKTLQLVVGSFIGLGILLRVVRFALNYPLWSDEAFVAANFLRRDYLDLLRPLDYGQICPVLFLWAVRACVGAFGFNEFSLRIFSLLCGIASLGLFVKAARNLLSGLPFLFALALFAVSSPLVRYASEVKPYASDLLAALLLIVPALEWLKNREGPACLWRLAAFTPLALGLSSPAVFVAGGISFGLLIPVLRAQRRATLIPFLVFNLAIVLVFPSLYFLVLLPQSTVLPSLRADYWVDAFPPMGSPFALFRWVVAAHTGKMLGYPGGGSGGASTMTLVLMVAGSITLWKNRRRAALAALLGAFVTAFVAAALRKYPYGFETRTMQFIAPAVCLLAGAGLDAMMRLIPGSRIRRTVAAASLVGLFAGGLISGGQFVSKPFINPYDVKARAFARTFWVEQAEGSEVACLMHDFGVYERTYLNLYSAIYLCNQMIYAPSRRPDLNAGPRWDRITTSHPLRCVLFRGTPVDHPRVKEWLAAMAPRFEVHGVETIRLDMSDRRGPRFIEPIVVFTLVPRSGMWAEHLTAAPIGAVRR